ncbi:alkaline phosphatase [Vibrio parahaemolyticus]|uniref:BREX-1 system phosphatase PglZ type B n=1 Tax=Vibrio parahaemolyticus TaxID=670 RepID=UPI000412EFB5|nr:BREX-1 system phosphatase PglZ type B [Vibrio parahaemolyticus]EGR3302284.1 BREX-1 system phosphatase PglZ type B [Vibrio parahaemolyticus]EGR3304643.1 BREX-1 system phosphatase PglZ type B [Vibrio parahaemolyticus]EGR3317736.1 BREX-1 system phosphatase PglZ type B [Vibrio parahaemolyticus]EMA7643307.1 BREX-1 system phosphatase PglZ type B [Vibrio parahaemolyticus]KHF05079.1 alkaline phosphatase [Vibrio parahaemolyticus]
MLIVEYLKKQLRECAAYNKSVQVAPAAILWTDIDCQWQSAMSYIKQQLPELFELGDYKPDERTGPAIWVKCAIAGKLEECPIPDGLTPIIYLPGVGRKDLRAIEQCPEFLKPLAELQYRGSWWAYNSAGRDWSVGSFLTNPKVGLSLDLAKDKKTQEAILKVLRDLLETPASKLQGKKLEAEDFYSIVLDDPIRDVLGWLNNPEEKAEQWQGSKWDIFSQSCATRFDFTPETNQVGVALDKLCDAHDEWQSVWERFEETAGNLPKLVEKLRNVYPSGLAFNPQNYLSENIRDEKAIEDVLKSLVGLSRDEIKEKLSVLWAKQQERKTWLWTSLGLSPWLSILEELITVLDHTEVRFNGADLDTMAEHYKQRFWQADAAVLRCMANTQDIHQHELVANILAAVYTPWLTDVTINFQRLVGLKGYPGRNVIEERSASYNVGSEVTFFVDGLRFDTAKMLESKLVSFGISVDLQSTWSAAPSLTATAKPAVTPLTEFLTGLEDNNDFKPALTDSQAIFSSHYLQKLLSDKGWQYLDGLETGEPKGLAWVQTGDLDNLGHEQQQKMPYFIDKVLDDVVARIRGLLDAGWQRIRIVTDHGWLWVPDSDGLPKADLSKSLGKNRQRRCAILKDNVKGEGLVVPWHWNPSVSVAMAPGISAYVKGDNYNHGGVSLQECLTPVLQIKRID